MGSLSFRDRYSVRGLMSYEKFGRFLNKYHCTIITMGLHHSNVSPIALSFINS